MKKHRLSLLLLVPFIFIACGSPEPLENAEPVSSADEVLDVQIFSDATAKMRISRCDDIANEDQKAECKTIVQDLLISADAVESLDKSKCSQIELDRYQEECEIRVKDAIDDANAVANSKAEIEKLQAIEAQAIEVEDVSICDQIEDANKMYGCRYNVIANRALNENDPSICDEIGRESFVSECKSNFDVQ